MSPRSEDLKLKRERALLRHPQARKQRSVRAINAREPLVNEEGNSVGPVAREEELGERLRGAGTTDFFVEAEGEDNRARWSEPFGGKLLDRG